jgi:signal transduction histidine kinase
MFFTKTLMVSFLSMISYNSIAQTPEIDSLFEHNKFERLKDLLFQSKSSDSINFKLAKTRYYNTFKQLEESFKVLYSLDTTTLDSRQKAHYFYNLGESFDMNSNFDFAALNYTKAQLYFKEIGDLVRYNRINLDLFYTVANEDIYQKPVDYLDDFQKTAIELKDPMQMVDLEIELAYMSLESSESTEGFLDHIHKAYRYLEKDPNIYKLANVHTYHAMYYTDVVIQKDSAEFYYNRGIDIYEQLGLLHKAALGYFSLGDLNSFIGDYEQAVYWTKKANSYRNFNYDFELTAYINKKLAKDYKALNQLDSAYKYLNESLLYRDSIDITQQNITLTRFEAEKKERENLVLEKKNERNKSVIYGSIGAFTLLVFLSIAIYQNARKKQLLIQKNKALEINKIQEELKEQEIKAIDALVVGQERERARLASDLHDNIGSNFTAIKSYFDHLYTELKATSSKPLGFDRAYTLLEQTYQDIRSLAHLKHSSLMADNELIPALSILSKNISSFSKIEVDFFHFIPIEDELDDKLELNVFRIIQETMANVVKHSQASTASISLTKSGDLLNIIVEDNGVGFNKNKIEDKESFGLQSIKQRVTYLKGEFTIDSTEGNGTTLIIDIPL